MSSIYASETVARRYLVGRPLDHDPVFFSFAATDQQEGRDVLLLALNPQILSSVKDYNLFLQRIEHSIFLRTPGVVDVNRVIWDQGQAVIICDLASGQSLRALVDTKRRKSEIVTPAEGISILRAIARVLEASPARAHGYLIPNVVFVDGQRLALAAFGLIQALPVERLIEAFAQDPAVRRYLAPEVQRGRFGEPGSDSYSLAVLAVELLGAPRPRELLGGVLDAAVDQRPRSSLALVDELEAALRLAGEGSFELDGVERGDGRLVSPGAHRPAVDQSAAPRPPASPVVDSPTDWKSLQPRDLSVSSSRPGVTLPVLPPLSAPRVPLPPETAVKRSLRVEAPPKNALVRWDPATTRRLQVSKPLIVPSSDSWSWGLLLAMVGGLLFAVYLVAFVAVTLLD